VAASATAHADHHAAHTLGGPVAHHFNNLRQQQATVRFGMWMFLVTEVMFFGGVMCAYTAYRMWFPNEFAAGSAALNVGIATVNTFLLLTSSLTITLAIGACYRRDRVATGRWILATIVLGAAFLAFKAREYHLDYQEGLLPGAVTTVHYDADGRRMNKEQLFVESLRKVLHEANFAYAPTGPYTPFPAGGPAYANEKSLEEARQPGSRVREVNLVRVQLFFMFYYSMTGLHVLHMIIGLGLLLWQYILTRQGFFDYPERYVYIEVLSLYWHLVDLVWVFLLPLLYLAGPHHFGQIARGLGQAFGVAEH
jgi:cytochrome c oxidase subunit III